MKSPAAQELLETVGSMFLSGYAHAAGACSPAAAEEHLEQIPTQFRGFAYEGAAMGFTMLDALTVARGRRITEFLAGRGDDHVYMVYVGIGWAMARLPRFRWPRIRFDPLLRWLVLDGYGFHQAYFHTGRYVHGRFEHARFEHGRLQDTRLPWPADHSRAYAGRAIDQGIGRALWFVGGADAELVGRLIERFPAPRRPDLYSGAGLAATYAGGADEAELRGFWKRAGEYRPQVAQGCAFAAEARLRAGLVVPHTQVATQVFCDMTPAEAARVCAAVRPGRPVRGGVAQGGVEGGGVEGGGGPDGGGWPAYELWRQRIAGEFVSLGRS